VKNAHPALRAVLEEPKSAPHSDCDRDSVSPEQTTSLSLARALAVGCLSRLNPSNGSVDIWDPAAGSGFAGFLLVDALQSAGIQVRYRGQDINQEAVLAGRRRFEAVPDAELAVGDTLANDDFVDFEADLVMVDAPWGMTWASSASAVESRRESGAFRFGVPQQSDSTWLFISLALEKLRPAAQGGGRVAALVAPGALSVGGGTGAMRQRIVEAGLLESVTRLPEGLAPNTSITLYLLTFTNSADGAEGGKVTIADLQTQFTTSRRQRAMPVSAFRELESGLRTRKPGPRNRAIEVERLFRREALLSREASDGHRLSWRLATYRNAAIDERLLESRYGAGSGISVDTDPTSIVDLDPSPFFEDDSRDLLKDMQAKGWACRRLSQLLTKEPEATNHSTADGHGHLLIPTTRSGKVSTEPADAESTGRVLSIQLDADVAEPAFLAAWLNSEQGVASRRHAIEASSSGTHLRALRSDPRSLMRWADELIIPLPPRSTQLALASADERLGSYHAELNRQRESIWAAPDSAADVVSRIANAFDDSVNTWLDQLPFPIASALWTAETATSPGDQQRAYLHAWEAIVTFHATVLLSATRCDPGSSSDVEAAIGQTLREQHLGIERASFGTWVVIVEKTSKELRRALEGNDPDDAARIRNAFGDLSQTGIERLISKDVVKKFNELSGKRNRWSGHTGYTSADEWKAQVASLVSDLTNLRQLLGDVWTHLLLVRAGSAKRTRDGYVQKAEVAVGTRSPFRTQDFRVGEPMMDGELYLVREGSQSPLRLGQFVQLRAAPRNAQYTTYFYNRTEGTSVRMVSYQHGPESEMQADAESFRAEFGALALR
jgi:type I restriction enzyme M protein